jgi:hypothetical protein
MKSFMVKLSKSLFETKSKIEKEISEGNKTN